MTSCLFLRKLTLIIGAFSVVGVLCDCRANVPLLGHRDSRVTGAGSAVAALPDVSRVGVDSVMSWSTARNHEAELAFTQNGQPRYPSPNFWGDETIYEIMIDRFNDGDSSNNFSLISEAQRNQGLSRNRGIEAYHHGGDLKGITKRLDYLADLGISAIWVTPIFENSNGSYHGYCVSDLTKIDPNFGSAEDLAELVRQAHAKGIRVILDVVVNHLCDPATKYVRKHTPAEHTACADDLARADASGSPTFSPNQVDLAFSESFFPPLKLKYFFNRCGENSHAEMAGAAATTVFGDFTSEMLDYDTRNTDFQRIFTNIMEYWIAFADVDGFRLDAVKHTTSDFTAYFSTEIRDYARKLGKNHFYVVAEIAGDSLSISQHLGRMNSAQNTATWRNLVQNSGRLGKSILETAQSNPDSPYPGVSGVFDFAHSGISRDVLTNVRSSRILENYFLTDTYYRDLVAQGDPRLNLTVLEIHDWARLTEQQQDKARLGLSYLAVAPGIPVIYYGLEQAFNGQCVGGSIDSSIDQAAMNQFCSQAPGTNSDAHYRQDMFVGGMFRLGSAISEINQLAHIGPLAPAAPSDWQSDPYLARDHDVYVTARRFLKARKSCSALRRGGISWRWSTTEQAGLMAFSRVDPANPSAEALVLVNTSGSPIQIPDLLADNRKVDFVNLESPSEIAHPKSDGSGLLEFSGRQIGANRVLVYVPITNLGPKALGDEIYTCQQ